MSDRWSTPDGIFKMLDMEFGFTMDVCAEKWNAKCNRYLTPEIDGLSVEWYGVCWMNPPYGREIGKWIQKAHEESARGAEVVCLVPARTETEWWHKYCMRAHEIRFVRKRIHFEDPDGRSGRPRFGSAIVVFNGIKSGMAKLRIF